MLNETLEAQREYQRDLQDAYNRGYAKGKEDQAREQHEVAEVTVRKTAKGVTLWYECGGCGEPVESTDRYCRNCGRELNAIGLRV